MEKTEMMNQIEHEAELNATIQTGTCGELPRWWYVLELERRLEKVQAKATAYDRLMSGEYVKTAKDAANIFGRAVASVDRDWHVFENVPVYDGYRWWDMKSRNSLDGEPIPFDIDPFDGDEANSLTLPDGWEEK